MKLLMIGCFQQHLGFKERREMLSKRVVGKKSGRNDFDGNIMILFYRVWT